MANVYLLIFDPAGVSKDRLTAFMDGSEKVVDYHTSMPTNLIVVVSPLAAAELAPHLKGAGDMNNFVVSKIEPQRLGSDIFGWLPQALWDFIVRYANRPTPVATPTGDPPQVRAM